MMVVRHASGSTFNSKYTYLLLDNDGLPVAGFNDDSELYYTWGKGDCERFLERGLWVRMETPNLVDNSHGVLKNIDPKVDVHYQEGAAFVTVVVPADKARQATEVLTALLSDDPLLTAVRAVYMSDGRVSAIRKCKELTGWSLSAARNWVDDRIRSTTNDA